MRSICLAAASMIALALPAITQAEPAPKATRTAEQIVCELTGECADAKLDPSKRLGKGKEGGFSLARPAGESPAAKPAPKAGRGATGRVRVATTTPPRAGLAATAAPAGKGLDMRINFAFGSAEMTAQSRAEAQVFARALKMPALAKAHFTVAGHTDATGSHDDNVRLSQARAEAVTAYLRSLGVEAERLTPMGYGPDSLLPNIAPTAAANRRVEIVPEGGSVSAGL